MVVGGLHCSKLTINTIVEWSHGGAQGSRVSTYSEPRALRDAVLPWREMAGLRCFAQKGLWVQWDWGLLWPTWRPKGGCFDTSQRIGLSREFGLRRSSGLGWAGGFGGWVGGSVGRWVGGRGQPHRRALL